MDVVVCGWREIGEIVGGRGFSSAGTVFIESSVFGRN